MSELSYAEDDVGIEEAEADLLSGFFEEYEKRVARTLKIPPELLQEHSNSSYPQATRTRNKHKEYGNEP